MADHFCKATDQSAASGSGACHAFVADSQVACPPGLPRSSSSRSLPAGPVLASTAPGSCSRFASRSVDHLDRSQLRERPRRSGRVRDPGFDREDSQRDAAVETRGGRPGVTRCKCRKGVSLPYRRSRRRCPGTSAFRVIGIERLQGVGRAAGWPGDAQRRPEECADRRSGCRTAVDWR